MLDGTFIVRDIEIKRTNIGKSMRQQRSSKKDNSQALYIKTPTSLHIIKLKDYQPEHQATLEEVRGWFEEKLRGEYQLKRHKKWVEELEKDAKIEVISFLIIFFISPFSGSCLVNPFYESNTHHQSSIQ